MFSVFVSMLTTRDLEFKTTELKRISFGSKYYCGLEKEALVMVEF